MSGLLTAIGGFVSGLLAVEVPGLGIPMLALICGLWILTGVGHFVFNIILDWPEPPGK